MTNKTVQENTDKGTQYKSEEVNNLKYRKTKLPWFSCLLQHSARKLGRLILQRSRACTGPESVLCCSCVIVSRGTESYCVRWWCSWSVSFWRRNASVRRSLSIILRSWVLSPSGQCCFVDKFLLYLVHDIVLFILLFCCLVVCLERGADLHMAQLMPLPLAVSCFSCFSIIQLLETLALSLLLPVWGFYASVHAIDDARGIMFLICLCVHICACLGRGKMCSPTGLL